jgi:hypothetical protein
MKKHVLVALFALSTLWLTQSIVQAGSCPSNCNGHGVCNSGVCTCNVGFTGPDCGFCAPHYYNYPTCTYCESSTTCSNNGTCGATGNCNCNAGYSGANCQNGPPPVPTVSEWGLGILTLTGLIAGTVLFTRRYSNVSA